MNSILYLALNIGAILAAFFLGIVVGKFSNKKKNFSEQLKETPK